VDGDGGADATAPWPDSRPGVAFGTITLTARVHDADPEMRKIIFDPVPRVDGIDPPGGPLTEMRSAIYLLGGLRRRAAGVR
jgi:catalase